jgi:hypothetical protein
MKIEGGMQVAKKSQPFPPWVKHQAAARQIPQPDAPDKPDDSTAKGGLAEEQHRARGRTRTAYTYNRIGTKRRDRRNGQAGNGVDAGTPALN